MINEQSYRYLTGEEMKGFGDESAPIDVTRDERCDANTGEENIYAYNITIYVAIWVPTHLPSVLDVQKLATAHV